MKRVAADDAHALSCPKKSRVSDLIDGVRCLVRASVSCMFEEFLQRWGLAPDGDPVSTHSSRLLPVRWRGQAAMLKIALEPEEKSGHLLMEWWDGDGAARVHVRHGDALLMERALGGRSLSCMAAGGEDSAATRILCAAIARLHVPRDEAPPALVDLKNWFRALWSAADAHGGLLLLAADHAHALLAYPHTPVVLHGDIHHDNVLDFGERGWLAIDPKGLQGERAFDYANLFCNPEQFPLLATDRFTRRLDVVLEASGLERRRLLQWIVAWSGLSAAWWMEDGVAPALDFEVMRRALAALEA